MKSLLTQSQLDRFFRIAVVIKGLNGLAEVIGGLILLLVPAYRLGGWIEIASFEFTEGHHAFIAQTLARLDQSLTPGLALLGALYLMAHGAIKLGLVAALLRERYRVYPYAMAFMLLFIFYQSYRVGLDHSPWLAALTAFDCLVTGLIYMEWRRHATPGRLTTTLPPLLLPAVITRRRRRVWLAAVSVTWLGSAATLIFAWPALTNPAAAGSPSTFDAEAVTKGLTLDATAFERRQTELHIELASRDYVQPLLDRIGADLVAGHRTEARQHIISLRAQLTLWNRELTGLSHQPVAINRPASTTEGTFIPVVLYHYPPANFEEQLAYLEQHGYTPVDLDQVAAAMTTGSALPTKPVVLTFDDGFANQMKAFALLQHHQMRATYYIINGGPASKWCVGSGRRYHDPLQPPGGCGDSYLSWDQVRQLDRSGLITIGGHTLDHADLPTLPLDQQLHEIADSKSGIEQQLGHPIRHFAYPYGAFTATTVALVQQAGYITATTTQSGAYQAAGSLYTLRRLRDTLTLP